jgi:hydroxypyruvate isomerase
MPNASVLPSAFSTGGTAMTHNELPDRRFALKALGAGAIAAAAATETSLRAAEPHKAKGNIKQSICRWCYNSIKLEKLAEEAKKIGYQSIELLSPEEIKKVKDLGLTCAVMRCKSGIVSGMNRKENHDRIVKELHDDIDFAAAEGIPSVLTMSGNRQKLADDVGLAMCAVGLKRILKYAEEKKIIVLMEGLNSKVDHKDYMYDFTEWGVKLCKEVGSPNFKLLYDIYHMQIMEGDVVRTIRKYKDFIGHFHTGGNPGRNEIDETQELNYPAIVKAIIDTGYQGYIGQEFIPKREAFASLAQGFRICDV